METTNWRTSSYTVNGGQCVEVADGIIVRDTFDRGGPQLSFTPAAWAAFTARLR